jgi:hypothetical protein
MEPCEYYVTICNWFLPLYRHYLRMLYEYFCRNISEWCLYKLYVFDIAHLFDIINETIEWIYNPPPCLCLIGLGQGQI